MEVKKYIWKKWRPKICPTNKLKMIQPLNFSLHLNMKVIFLFVRKQCSLFLYYNGWNCKCDTKPQRALPLSNGC